MKKFISAILASAIFLLVLGACGTGDVGDKEYMSVKQNEQSAASVQEQSSHAANEPSKLPGIQSLCEYFEYNHYVIADKKSEVAAEMIGAISGVRYAAISGPSTFNIELYEYDPTHMNDNASGVIGSIESTGSFIVLGRNVPAVISNNGKYMMVYTDTSTEQANLDHRAQVEEVLKSWP